MEPAPALQSSNGDAFRRHRRETRKEEIREGMCEAGDRKGRDSDTGAKKGRAIGLREKNIAGGNAKE